MPPFHQTTQAWLPPPTGAVFQAPHHSCSLCCWPLSCFPTSLLNLTLDTNPGEASSALNRGAKNGSSGSSSHVALSVAHLSCFQCFWLMANLLSAVTSSRAAAQLECPSLAECMGWCHTMCGALPQGAVSQAD